jgi:hypothetical protein
LHFKDSVSTVIEKKTHENSTVNSSLLQTISFSNNLPPFISVYVQRWGGGRGEEKG